MIFLIVSKMIIVRYKKIGYNIDVLRQTACLVVNPIKVKVVICGEYKNLNKIIKILHISLKFHRLLIFVILHSLQCKIEGHAV